MKKTYIEPKNTVVCIKLETLITQSPTPGASDEDATSTEVLPGGGNVYSRDVIKSQDAWEEW